MAKRQYPRGAGWLPLAPTNLPAFGLMFEEIGASPARLARHLGCERTTIYTWLAGAPVTRRAYALAMFYETSWGRSFVNTKAENDARLYGSLAIHLRSQLAKAHAELQRLGAIAEFGSANDPHELVVSRTIRQIERQPLVDLANVELVLRRAA